MIVDLNCCEICAITVNYNGHQDCDTLLLSLEQSQEKIGVICVDNASQGSLIDEVVEKYEGVFLIKNGRNLGFGAANNIAALFLEKYENVRFLFFINNDAVVLPDAITRLRRNFSLQKCKIGALSPLILEASDQRTVWFEKGSFSLYNGGAKSHRKGLPYQKIDDELVLSPFVTGCALFIEKNVFKDIGMFDESYFMYYEDIDLSWKLTTKGFFNFVDREAVVYHKSHSSIKDGAVFDSPVSKNNKNFRFYFDNVVKGALIFSRKSTSGYKRVVFRFVLFLKWLRNCIKAGRPLLIFNLLFLLIKK